MTRKAREARPRRVGRVAGAPARARLRMLFAVALAMGGCGSPSYPAWTIALPEGTRTLGYDVAPAEQRGDRHIELLEDRLIGGSAVGSRPGFYRAAGMVVDDDGNMFVLDAGNHRIVALSPAGDLLAVMGGEGQGPGELASPDLIALAADRIVVNDRALGRLSWWSRDGRYLGSHAHRGDFNPRAVYGTPAGELLGSVGDASADPPTHVIVRYSLEGVELSRLWEVPMQGLVSLRGDAPVARSFARGFRTGGILARAEANARFAVARDGALYLAAGDEYQILALSARDQARWAVRTAYPRPSLPIERIDELARRSQQGLTRNDFDWGPLPAIETMRVDGHGHLWVFPTAPPGAADDDAPQRRPVDVYSPDGDLLFSGTAPYEVWSASLGDFVYAITVRGDTGEQVVVRYRLQEPFS